MITVLLTEFCFKLFLIVNRISYQSLADVNSSNIWGPTPLMPYACEGFVFWIVEGDMRPSDKLELTIR